MKAERIKSLKGHFEEEGEGFLWGIVTGDENWVHHCDPEKKDGLWNTSTKYHQCERNSKPKRLLVKSCWLYSRNVKVLYWLTSWKKVLLWFQSAILQPLKLTKNAAWGRGRKLMTTCFSKTIPGLTQALPQLMPLRVWGLQCYHIQTTAKILPLVISTCSTNRRNTSGTKTTVLNKESRLQCTSVFGESERIF